MQCARDVEHHGGSFSRTQRQRDDKWQLQVVNRQHAIAIARTPTAVRPWYERPAPSRDDFRVDRREVVQFADGRESAVGQRLDHRRRQVRQHVVRQHQHGQVAQLRDRDLRAPRDGVCRRDGRRIQRVPIKDGRGDAGFPRWRRRADGDVRLARAQQTRVVDTVDLAHVEIDLRQLVPQGGEPGAYAIAEQRHGTNGDAAAAQSPVPGLPRPRDEVGDAAQRFAGRSMDAVAGNGQTRAPSLAHEQLGADLLFEIPNLARQGRLGDAKERRATREAAGAHHRVEIPQMPHVHSRRCLARMTACKRKYSLSRRHCP